LPLFLSENLHLPDVTTSIVSSVVPLWNHSWQRFCSEIFKSTPLFLEPGIKTGIKIAVDNPKEVGADRIVNSVAAIEKHPDGAIVVDSGTAITIDVISPEKVYLGGSIMPGIIMTVEALASRTAKLGRISLEKPEKAIGKTTSAGIKSGIYHGFTGMIDKLIEESLKEIDFNPTIISTGGMAGELSKASKFITLFEKDLTLIGLNTIAKRNRR